jgi:lysophospholipase L1-like esterase
VGPAPLRRARRTGVALLAAVAFVAAGLELGVKLHYFGWHASPKELLIPSDDAVLIYRLDPGLEADYTYLNPYQRDWPWSVSIGEHGFRGPPFAASESRPRIVILGDSYAFGYGVDDDDTFSHLLAARLGGDATVLNAAVPGYNLVQQTRLLERNLDAWRPAVVVLAMHPNDLEPPIFESAEQLRRVRLSHLYAAWLHVRFVAGGGAEAALARSLPERSRRALEALDRMVAMETERDFRLLLFQASCWSSGDDPAFYALLALARSRGVPVLAADGGLCAQLDAASIPEDGHPSAEGHALLAERLESRVREMLRGAAGP